MAGLGGQGAGKEDKNCCVYTQQLNDCTRMILSLSLFHFLCLITWQAVLRPTR